MRRLAVAAGGVTEEALGVTRDPSSGMTESSKMEFIIDFYGRTGINTVVCEDWSACGLVCGCDIGRRAVLVGFWVIHNNRQAESPELPLAHSMHLTHRCISEND